MSNIVDKVKAKVENVLHKDESHRSTNAGPHDSNLANKADPRVDSDRDGSRNAGAAAYGTGAHHTGHHTAGPHGTDAGNKLDPRVDSDRDGSRNAGVAEYGPGSARTSATHTAGPHGSDLLNKADPRVDSDRDGSHNLGQAQYGAGAHHNTGTHTGYGTTGGLAGGAHSTNAGPHDSNLANKLDPRVDSDRDGSRNAGAAQYGAGAHHNTGTHTGYGTTGQGLTGGAYSTNAGPHDSNLANKLDPRVDSDLDGSRNAGAAQYGAGAHHTTGTHGGIGGATGQGLTGSSYATNAGPHDSNLANKLDPRVDSDRDGSNNLGAAHHGAHSGTGPAHGTAGPHSSNLANKLDPRVDSDLDGSRTVGGSTAY